MESPFCRTSPARRWLPIFHLLIDLFFSFFQLLFLFVSPSSLFSGGSARFFSSLLQVAGLPVLSWLTLWTALMALWVLLIWPFAIEKTEEEEAAEKGASVLMGL